jgi:peptide/nickel transport system permease protein
MRGLLAMSRAVLSLVLTLTALACVTFALASFSPIDPASQLAGDHASASSYAEARQELGLDLPWPARFGHYVQHLAHGDLGVSHATRQPVLDDLKRVFPATFELSTLALVLSALVGLGLSVLSTLKPGGFVDVVARGISIVGNSVPIFWLGLVSLFFFYAHLRWPTGPGRLDDAYEYTISMPTGLVLVDAWLSGMTGALTSAIEHIALPVILLALFALGTITRLTRAAFLAESEKDYVLLARAKGQTDLGIVLRHILPNTAGLTLTVLALAYASLLEGAVLIESVFARPGMGRYLTTALFTGDIPAIMGATLVIGFCFVTINSLTDAAVKTLDPRVR